MSGWSKVAQAACGPLVLTSFLLCPGPACAHKLYVYAQVKGATIEGRAYFPGDVPARKSDVIARDASGRELGRTTTDDEGKFTFTARAHVDYYLLAQTPDGHGGQCLVHASELPDGLPVDLPAAGSGSHVASPAADRAGLPAASAGQDNEPAGVAAQLTELRKQIQELRRQVFESDERLRFRDILGGIGFILGLAGVGFYVKARQRRTQARSLAEN
jgi:nickel transport protein